MPGWRPARSDYRTIMALRSYEDADSIEARQGLLDRACERNHPKRHRTKKRAKRLSAKKKQRVAHKLAIKNAARARHHALVRAYWLGEIENHP
jgi:hypothetical protein